MKTLKIILKIIMVFILLIVIKNSYVIYATEVAAPVEDAGTTTGINYGNYNPYNENNKGLVIESEKLKTIISTILGVLQGIGIVTITISIALIGFNYILGSASEKAVSFEKFGGILVAAIMITSGITIANWLISIFS